MAFQGTSSWATSPFGKLTRRFPVPSESDHRAMGRDIVGRRSPHRSIVVSSNPEGGISPVSGGASSASKPPNLSRTPR